MTCGAHTASQPWRRHRRARDTCPETPDINRATSRAPRALSCTYTFDPVQWVGTCKRNRPEPTKHAPAMPMARVPSSLVRVSKMTKLGPPFPIWQLRQPPPSSPLSGPHALFAARPAHHACGGGRCCALCDESASSSRCHAQSSSPSPPSPSSPASASVRASFARHVFPQPDSNAPSSSAHLAYVALMPPNSFLYYSPNKTLHRKTLTPSPRSGPSDGSPKSSRSFPKGVTL